MYRHIIKCDKSNVLVWSNILSKSSSHYCISYLNLERTQIFSQKYPQGHPVTFPPPTKTGKLPEASKDMLCGALIVARIVILQMTTNSEYPNKPTEKIELYCFLQHCKLTF